LYIYFCLG